MSDHEPPARRRLVVVAVDGRDVRNLGTGAVGYLLRGKPGTRLTLTVQRRSGEQRTVAVTLAEPQAEPPAVAGQTRPNQR